jgi:hypothetical protein
LGVRVENDIFFISKSFKFLSYFLVLIYAFFVLMPIIIGVIEPNVFIFLIIIFINSLFFIVTFKMVNLKRFERQEVRKYIVLQYIINWLNIPILLMSIAPLSVLFILFPIIGLVISNMFLYRTIFRPQVL